LRAEAGSAPVDVLLSKRMSGREWRYRPAIPVIVMPAMILRWKMA
jgi:hypothetical protein